MVQQPSDPTQPPSWWAVTSANGINDNGAIIGLANFTQIPYAPVQHGVLLLPCQFRLLNGDTNPNDVDGMDFFGNRPTTISATANYGYMPLILATNCIYNNGGPDVLGAILPIGAGRIDAPNESDVDSIFMIAKVCPSTAANVTYAWARYVEAGDFTIAHTSTNTWYVDVPLGAPIGVLTNDTGENIFYTNSPSANYNTVAFGDAPGMYIPNYTAGAPHVNDYAYHKLDFTYYLTNSIGSTNAITTEHVGQIMVIKRIATNGNASDWTNAINILSTTNIPNCSGLATNEIQSIVGTTNPIIFSPNVPVTY